MTKRAPATKPTVFLSHSSSDRRELIGLKNLLDARAGGRIQFFLSSDNVSIPHGTIWPAEVKAALDRMKLMLIFVSPAALKSGWTYFEAGYGLNRLGSAKIYCLPETDKAELPSPFDLLQNRNLHGPKDVAFLIHQINEAFNARLDEAVTRTEFEAIFRRPLVGQVEVARRLSDVIQDIVVETDGPPDSAACFREACKRLGLASSTATEENNDYRAWCSVGVRIAVREPYLEKKRPEISISAEVKKRGYARVSVSRGGSWEADDPLGWNEQTKSLEEIAAYNLEVKRHNAEVQQRNEQLLREPRACRFTLSPIDLSLPVRIVDEWHRVAKVPPSGSITIRLQPNTVVEARGEVVGAKIHGSTFTLREDGSLQWREQAVVKLVPARYGDEPHLALGAISSPALSLAELQLDELVGTLCDLHVLEIPAKGKNGRRRGDR
jgi:hypothetical protein